MKFSKILKEETLLQDKIVDSILNKFDAGTLLIDFAINPSNREKIKLEVEFRGDCIWLFSRDKLSKYEEESKGPIQIFSSVNEFVDSMTYSMYSINQHVDKKAVAENLFDPESFKHVIKQISEFAREYPEKAKSLQHKNNQWDVEIKFRRSLRRLSGIKTKDDYSSPYVIYPAISGENKWGRIVAPKEKELLDPSIWEHIQTLAGK